MVIGKGELVAVKRGKRAIQADAKQHIWSQLLFVARHRNKSRGWASHQYRDLFEVWPRNLRDVPAAPSSELLDWIRSRAIAYATSRASEIGEAHHA